MANLYKKYMRLLDKWPVDKSISNDLGLYICEQVKIAFPKGEHTKIEDKEKCKRYYESLERIALNQYSKKYPHPFTKTATGLTPEQCSEALSPEFLKYVNKQKLGFFAKCAKVVKDKFSKKSDSSETKTE